MSIPNLTRHAAYRCVTRCISIAAVDAAMDYGNCRHGRGAVIYILGWREVRYWQERGIDLSRWEGVEVVVAHDGQILTTYRNRHPRAIRDRADRLAA